MNIINLCLQILQLLNLCLLLKKQNSVLSKKMDYHSKLLVNLKSNGSASVSEISDVIIGWKNTFSFYWYHQYINDDQKKLDFIFNLLFELFD